MARSFTLLFSIFLILLSIKAWAQNLFVMPGSNACITKPVNSNTKKVTLLHYSFPGSAYPMNYSSRFVHPCSLYGLRLKDSLPKRKFGRSAVELMAAEIIPWVTDEYIRKMDYTQISLETVEYNLKPANWAWDGDGFTTNQFGHAYHGGVFFSSFRANGYSFWQSAPAAFVGSYLWETFSENQAPAPNDLINTGYGGIIIGEMTYRLANKIINNRTTGVKRQATEVIAFLLNPANGVTRILDGRWGKRGTNSPERDSSVIYTEFDAGFRKFRADHQAAGFGFYGHIRFLYNTPFENYKTPFSNISINAEFGKDDSSVVNIVSIYGSLRGWKFGKAKKAVHLLMLSANYDYINNEAFFYSAESLKLNLISETSITKNITVNATVGTGLILLAAVPDKYLYMERNYDYCSGVGFQSSFMIGIAKHLYCSVNYRGGWLKTISGNGSDYFLHAVTGEARYRIISGFSVCAEPGYFTLRGSYKKYSTVNSTYPYIRFSLRYSFNFK